MALADFTVSKRRSRQLASNAIDQEVQATDRTRLLNHAILDLRSEGEIVEEISKLWSEAQEKFLSIGRYLLRAKTKFSGSFESQIVANLPFGKNIAYQLRMVAEAVDMGRMPEKDLPRSYATAYQLVSLPSQDFDAARAQGLVRSSVTRPEVISFRRDLKEKRLTQGDYTLRLSKERERLILDVQKTRDYLQSMEQRLAEIESQIG